MSSVPGTMTVWAWRSDDSRQGISRVAWAVVTRRAALHTRTW